MRGSQRIIYRVSILVFFELFYSKRACRTLTQMLSFVFHANAIICIFQGILYILEKQRERERERERKKEREKESINITPFSVLAKFFSLPFQTAVLGLFLLYYLGYIVS